MPKMTVRVILKSGVEFSIKCDKFTLTRNGFQQVTGYNIEGITENKPVYLDFEQVAAVVRVFADEKPETDDTPEEKRLFTETPMQYPFCEGENSNARVYEDKQNTAYFHDYIYGKAEIRFVRGRIRFTDDDGNAADPAPFPSMVVIYNGERVKE